MVEAVTCSAQLVKLGIDCADPASDDIMPIRGFGATAQDDGNLVQAQLTRWLATSVSVGDQFTTAGQLGGRRAGLRPSDGGGDRRIGGRDVA